MLGVLTEKLVHYVLRDHYGVTNRVLIHFFGHALNHHDEGSDEKLSLSTFQQKLSLLMEIRFPFLSRRR